MRKITILLYGSCLLSLKPFPLAESCAIWGEWDYTKPRECTGSLQRQPESRRRIKVCRADAFKAKGWSWTQLPAGELSPRSPWGRSWRGWLCHPPSLCVFSSERRTKQKDVTQAACIYKQELQWYISSVWGVSLRNHFETDDRCRERNIITQCYVNLANVTHKAEVPRGARGEKCKWASSLQRRSIRNKQAVGNFVFHPLLVFAVFKNLRLVLCRWGIKKRHRQRFYSNNVFSVSSSLRVEWRPRSPECTARHLQPDYFDTAFKSCNNEL